MAKSVFYGASISKYLGFNALHPTTRDYGRVPVLAKKDKKLLLKFLNKLNMGSICL